MSGQSWGSWLSDVTSSISKSLGFDAMEVVDPSGAKPTDTKVDERRASFLSTIRDFVGQDVQSLLSVPVYFMEPFTTLQKVAEVMEHADLMDRAAATADPAERLALVVAFAVSQYGAVERCYKPFNPILGETFEYHDEQRGAHLMAEQVSHHPPIAAMFADAPAWTYQIISAPKTKFLGNSVEVYPLNRCRITVKATGEQYYLVPPTTVAHNIILGYTWIDTYGTYEAGSVTSGYKCALEFTPCGWLSQGRYEFSGHVTDADGKRLMVVRGKWNANCEIAKCDEDGEPQGAFERVWEARAKPEGDPYGFTYFARELNRARGFSPRPSDSRRRPDRYHLEIGENGLAQAAKTFVEEMQRLERKVRAERGDKWEPAWFKEVKSGFTIVEGEPEESEFPWYEWRGRDMTPLPAPAKGGDGDAGAGAGEGEEEDDGEEGLAFCPWQYPDVHKPLYFEDGGEE